MLLTYVSNSCNYVVCWAPLSHHIILLTPDISEQLSNDSAVALVDGEPWNMHMPLNNDCAVQFLSFKEHNPDEANKVCSNTSLCSAQITLVSCLCQ